MPHLRFHKWMAAVPLARFLSLSPLPIAYSRSRSPQALALSRTCMHVRTLSSHVRSIPHISTRTQCVSWLHNTMQHTATDCNTLPLNTLQHAVTQKSNTGQFRAQRLWIICSICSLEKWVCSLFKLIMFPPPIGEGSTSYYTSHVMKSFIPHVRRQNETSAYLLNFLPAQACSNHEGLSSKHT